jgi:hypothetical protein
MQELTAVHGASSRLMQPRAFFAKAETSDF